MYVLMGSNGNITSRAVRTLRQQGHPVRVIGRSAAALEPLRTLGAEIAVGDAHDSRFLAQVFEGATGLYVMIPTDYAAPDLRQAQARIGAAIATAIARSGVRRVVNLSSVGADLSTGTGPIVGLHEQEQRLDAIAGLDLLHLRPGYFMENHLIAAGAIVALGVYPSLERPDVDVPMVATPDIAAVVARELVTPTARGVLNLQAPRHYTFQHAATVLGRSIGKPDLAYVQSEPAQGRAAMLDAGFSPDAAERMAEMARWLSSGTHSADLPGAVEVTTTTLEDFAPRFREAFQAAQPA